ncbi:histidine--tRNA ligase [Synechococcus sp. Nb3U1]|uniref:histidine--tRNA ligase n=1 Tax=Synechococcus sp. Nb3U1 TaxID=1914529 RepID=UPI001F00CD16|nr:histidine--tRNA ligase [Synechococcus sp. Nb3U1]MCF2970512.1 histidine--tRNA ligase [Synechococcus sp. Nb3U1]
MEIIQAVRGTRDILPEEVGIWQQVEAKAREILGRASYQEIRTPIFELTELFARGIGSATDVVGKEMYSFSTRGEQEVSLRPENTAGVVRAYIQHGLQAAGDVQRLWYCGPMFRYERPQAGRQRQFHQLGLELIGSRDPRADAEVIALAWDLLQAVGAENLTLLLNSIGDPQDRLAYRQALVDYFTPFREELDPDSQDRLTRNPLRILDSKDPRTREIADRAPKLLQHLSSDSQAFFEQVQAQLQSLGIPYELDPYLVRGLDYYTHTAFEIVSPDLGAQSTVCGGGRYDGLVAELGGPSTPAVGWAMGMERLVLLLQKKQGRVASAPVQVYVISRGAKAEAQSLQIAQSLRQAGFHTELDLSGSAFGKQFKRASRSGAIWAVTLGDAEAVAGEVQLKHLPTGEQQTLLQADLANYLGSQLER